MCSVAVNFRCVDMIGCSLWDIMEVAMNKNGKIKRKKKLSII